MKAIRPHAALSAVVVLAWCSVGAGPLDPPTGPVTATTGPTLIEFGTGPYVISVPGKYKMIKDHAVTGNPSIGGVPIQINVGGVELDMNGKTLSIHTSAAAAIIVMVGGVTIKNGTILGDPSLPVAIIGNGMDLPPSCVLEDLEIRTAANVGPAHGPSVRIGDRSVIRRCRFRGGELGPRLGSDCLVEDSMSSGYESGGLRTGDRCMIRNVTVGPGFFGSIASFGMDCTIESSRFQMGGMSGTGLLVGDRCILRGCTMTGNMPASIGPGSLMADCAVATGAAIGVGTRVERCVFSGLVPQTGINAQLSMASQATVTGSTFTTTSSFPCIAVTGGACVIDSNTFHSSNPTIVSLTGSGSRVVRNSFTGAAAPISGGAGNDVGPTGTGATATSPWANLVN